MLLRQQGTPSSPSSRSRTGPPANHATTVASSPAASTLSPAATATPVPVAASLNADDVLATGAAPAVGLPGRAPIICLQVLVQTLKEQNMKKNTREMYCSKIPEYVGMCDHVYADVPEQFRYNVDKDRLYRLIFFVVFRNKKQRKGVKRGAGKGFNATEYDLIEREWRAKFQAWHAAKTRDPDSTVALPDPDNPIGYEMVTTYRSVVRWIWERQRALNANNISDWNQINTPDVQSLIDIVKGRRKRIDKHNHAEKVTGEDSPFDNYDKVDSVQEYFWMEGEAGTCSRTVFCAMRNRYSILANTAGILRNESQTKADLSDVRVFKVKRQSDPIDHDPIMVRMMKLGEGKTVQSEGSSQYGRLTRNKCVFQCPIGAEAAYLFYRFDVNNEFVYNADNPVNPFTEKFPNMRNNKEWFDIKILTELGGDNTAEMSQRSFTDKLKIVFKELGINSNHFGHFGRVVGPLICEFHELDPNIIKILGKYALLLHQKQATIMSCLTIFSTNTTVLAKGNWDNETQTQRYSAHVPLRGLLVMGGFPKNEGYWLPRSRLQPSAVLVQMIWPWLEDTLDYVKTDPVEKHPTAVATLEYWMELRIVLLQDAAAMQALTEKQGRQGWMNHTLFEYPVFKSEEFSKFVVAMAAHLEKEGQLEYDPAYSSVERALPGVNRQFAEVREEMTNLKDMMDGLKIGIREEMALQFRESELRALVVREQVEARAVAQHHGTRAAVLGMFRGLKRGITAMANELDMGDLDMMDDDPMFLATQLEMAQQERSPQQQQQQHNCTAAVAVSETESVLPPFSHVLVGDEESAAGSAIPSVHEDGVPKELAHARNKKFSFASKPTNKVPLKQIFEEYYGLGCFTGIPIEGGFHMLEQKYMVAPFNLKNKWRNLYKAKDAQLFSRVKIIVSALLRESGAVEGASWEMVEAIGQEWQQILTKTNVQKLVVHLQNQGIVPCKQRNKKAKATGT